MWNYIKWGIMKKFTVCMDVFGFGCTVLYMLKLDENRYVLYLYLSINSRCHLSENFLSLHFT